MHDVVSVPNNGKAYSAIPYAHSWHEGLYILSATNQGRIQDLKLGGGGGGWGGGGGERKIDGENLKSVCVCEWGGRVYFIYFTKFI